MKHIILFINLISFLLGGTPETALAEEPQFARVKNDGVYIYSSPSSLADNSNRLFEVQKSYFVELLDNAGSAFYRVKYMEVSGYIKKNEVVCVRGVPSEPYASASFRVFAPSGINLRSSPDSSSPFNIVDTIPFLSTSLIYYGKTNGEESISLKGNIWYYCQFLSSGRAQFGFVYSVFCDSLPIIPINVEILEEITEPSFGTPPSTESNEPLPGIFSLPIGTQVALIIGVSLPCLIILYLIFKPTKIATRAGNIKNMPRPKELKGPGRAVKHADYYELDELDL